MFTVKTVLTVRNAGIFAMISADALYAEERFRRNDTAGGDAAMRSEPPSHPPRRANPPR
jgi:hypothetical protein